MPHSHGLNFSQQSDDDAIDTFANAMRDKMALGRAEDQEGWQTCPIDVLWRMLREHVDKGNAVEVATLAMMIHYHSLRRA